MLNKLFINNSLKTPIKLNTFRPKYNLKTGSNKEYGIHISDKLSTKKKINKRYLDKMTTLLYTYKKEKNYSVNRNNIGKTIYKINSDNALCITLPKFYKNNSNVQKILCSTINGAEINNKKNLKLLKSFDSISEYRNLKSENNDNDCGDKKKKEFNLSNSVKNLIYNRKNERSLEQQKINYVRLQKQINDKNDKSFLFRNLPKINIKNNSINRNKNYLNEKKSHFNTLLTNSISNLRNLNKEKKYFSESKLNSVYQKAEKYQQFKKNYNMKNLFNLKYQYQKNQKKLKGKEVKVEDYKSRNNNKLINIEYETNQLMKQAEEIENELQKTFSEIEKYLIYTSNSNDEKI